MSRFWDGNEDGNTTAQPKDDELRLQLLSPRDRDGDRDGDDAHDARGRRRGDPAEDGSRRSPKIKALDGLRGVACFLVFNYHFLWPWTPLIMLGYGARPPRSPEPHTDWASLPIVCLLHRGRPMVAIFFAISGYVLCRHILLSIHRRNLDETYRKLASAVFRRIFRLYLPPLISMAMVALLAQLGAFRSEKAIFKGPDSVYINGTVTHGFFYNKTSRCPNGTLSVTGRDGVATALGLQTPLYLNETIKDSDRVCLDIKSKLHGPAQLYGDVIKPPPNKPNATTNGTLNGTMTRPFYDFAEYHRGDSYNPASKATPKGLEATLKAHNATRAKNFTWIQLGGSWEEHPVADDPRIFMAAVNFTVVAAEWANPFNFGHYHPRYDPHTWTIPKELRGSMVLYTFLLGTAALKTRWRMGAAAGLGLYALTFGYWDMGVFVGGMLLAEVDVLNAFDFGELPTHQPRGGRNGGGASARRSRLMRWAMILVALYLLSFPDAGAEFTPGFRILSMLVPRYYPSVSFWMYYQAIGAVMLVPCVLRSPTLRRLLEGQVAQYLGKISFSFYLVHGPVLHCLGFWIMPRLFDLFGRLVGFAMGWFMLLSVTFYLSGWFHNKIDTWSMTVGRRIERALLSS